jgi:CelD/BcsL family acetyltransferase involved in cellulose biosynthesis
MLDAVIPSLKNAATITPSRQMYCAVRSWSDSHNPEFIASWRTLTSKGVCSEPFYQPEWFQAFQVNLAPEAEPLFVTAYKGAELIGLLPLMQGRAGVGILSFCNFQSLSNLHSCRFDLIHDGTAKEEVAEAVWGCLRENRSWDVIEVKDVPTKGNFESLMACARADGFSTAVWPTRRMPYLPLPLAGHDPFKNCPERFKGSRARLKGKEKKLRQEGVLEFSLTTEAAPDILESFFRLEASGWKGQNGSAISLSTALVSFYTTIAKIAEKRGCLRIYSLKLDGQPIAMHFGLQMNGVYSIPKVAYDERYKRYSPGLVLTKYVIEAITKDGATCFDFLGPRMEWKSVWTSYVREHATCYIFNRTVRGALLKTALHVGAQLRKLKHRFKGDPQDY